MSIPSKSSNIPSINNTFVNPWEYENEIIDGYNYGIEAIQQNAYLLLKDVDFWDRLSKSKVRVLLRRTVAYYQAYRRMTIPDVAIDSESIQKLLCTYSQLYGIHDSEIEQLLQCDFPYFFTTVHSKTVSSISGNSVLEYPSTLKEFIINSIESFRKIPVQQTIEQTRLCLKLAKQIYSGEVTLE